MTLRCGRGSDRWDLSTDGTSTDSVIVAGVTDANGANRLQAFADQVRCAEFASLDRPPCEFVLSSASLQDSVEGERRLLGSCRSVARTVSDSAEVLVFAREQDRKREQLDASATGVITVPSGTLTIPTTAEAAVLGTIEAVTNAGQCFQRLCNAGPAAAVTSHG